MSHFRFLLPVTAPALCLAVVLLGGLSAPALAVDGDIIISRQVQPRVATRPAVVADPSPQVVNPRELVLRETGFDSGLIPSELSDLDFAHVTSGARVSSALHSMPPVGQTLGRAFSSSSSSGVAGMNPSGHGGGAVGRASGQVSQRVQQGLRPLQLIGGK